MKHGPEQLGWNSVARRAVGGHFWSPLSLADGLWLTELR